MAVSAQDIQKLYIAYFNRPADYYGLTFQQEAANRVGIAKVAEGFVGSPEFQETYGGKSTGELVQALYENLFDRTPALIETNYWVNEINSGRQTRATIALTLLNGAIDGPGGFPDATTVAKKVAAATAFYAAIDTTEEANNYSGPQANAVAKAWLANISDEASLQAAIAPAALNATFADIVAAKLPAQTATLTASVDTFTGGSGNDTVNAIATTGANGLTTFDEINGGNGRDTIAFVETATGAAAQFSLPTGATVTNFEVVNVATTGGVSLNTTSWTGVTNVNVNATGTAAAAVTVANTTDVALSSATTGATTVTGGDAVDVTLSAATAGTVGVTGAALSAVSIKGGAAATVDNTKADGTTAGGTTLTTVSLNGSTGATANLSGAALTNVNLTNIKQADAITVNNATAGHALNVKLDSVGYAAGGAAVAVSVTDANATSANINTAGKSSISLTGAKIETATLTGGADLVLNTATGNTKLTTIAGADATGALTLTAVGAAVSSISTGAGKDTVVISTATVKDTASTTADETVTATVATNDGDDTITVSTSGNGVTNVDSGAGNDTVNVAARGTTLAIDLGEGDDNFGATVAITAVDTINAGGGTDTLLLNLVGSANIGAFSGFDVFDTKNLAKTLDVDILTTKNTVSEIIASGDVGAGAALTNVGAGVNVRVTGEMAVGGLVPTLNVLTLTQKTAGAITVTVDADETGDKDTAADTASAALNLTNATSVNAVFGTDYLAKMDGETTTGDNVTTLNLTAGAATALTVDSSGTDAVNTLAYTDTNNKLAAVTVTGEQKLNLTLTSTSVANVNASAHEGGLVFSTASLKNGGNVTLGAGVDVITVASTSTSAAGATESVTGLEKAAAIAVSTATGDATAKAEAIAAADTLVFTGGTAANDATVAGGTVAKGVLTFTGAGPSTLDAAFLIAELGAETAGEVVAFEYLGNSYVFAQGTDVAVKLVGTVGITNLVETGTDAFFIV